MTVTPRTFAAIAVCFAAAGCQCGGKLTDSKPQISVAPTTLDFGTARPGDLVARSVEITNTSQVSLAIKSVHVDGDRRGAFVVGTLPSFIVDPQILAVTYIAPSAQGVDSAQLVIESDAENEPTVTIPLSGRSVVGCCAPDGGDDAGADSGVDAGVDAGSDAGSDAGGDAGRDAGGDAGYDAGSDGGAEQPDASYCGVAGLSHVSLALTNQYAVQPLVVWNGASYGTVWTERPPAGSTFNVWFNLLSSLGQPLGATLQVSAANGLSHAQARAAFSGSEYGVTYYENLTGPPYYRVLFSRVGTNGQPIAGSELPLLASSSIQNMPAIAWNPLDGEYGVAWSEEPPGTNTTFTLYFARIKNGALVAAPAPLRTGQSIFMSDHGSHVLIWTGTQYAMTWAEGNALYVGEISRTGALSSASLTAISTANGPDRPVLDFDGARYGVVWMDYRTGTFEVHFALSKAGGGYVAGSDLLLGTAGVYSGEPDVAWDGANFVPVWDESTTATGNDVWTARVSSTGAVASGSRRVLTCAVEDEWFPLINWNGSQHAVTYERTFGSPQQSTQELLLFP